MNYRLNMLTKAICSAIPSRDVVRLVEGKSLVVVCLNLKIVKICISKCYTWFRFFFLIVITINFRAIIVKVYTWHSQVDPYEDGHLIIDWTYLQKLCSEKMRQPFFGSGCGKSTGRLNLKIVPQESKLGLLC